MLALIATSCASAKDGVILLHGMCRTSSSMNTMQAALESNGFAVLNVNYPSRTANIAALSTNVIATALADPKLKDVQRIHFVTHSLGGILVRQYLSQYRDPRISRVVMLGPPNKGSEVVDNLGDTWIFQWLNGPAGPELSTNSNSVPNRLGPVAFELGVIAGDYSINRINSLMIPGPDDGKVSLASTKVEGMKQHIVLHTAHPFMMKNKGVIANTISFLRTGSFLPPKPGMFEHFITRIVCIEIQICLRLLESLASIY